ncbi:hypothetical protein GGH92_001366 [Coemansia sp. RSA 2673]|nr:hypothetical protein GGH92_001366 [Coemansia sp. RSA 2673]
MSFYFTTLRISLVVDTVVVCLAVLCLLTSTPSWRRTMSKRPIAAAVAANFVNVALLISNSKSPTDRFATSMAATLALSMWSVVSVSRGNLQACLHLARALSTASNLSLPFLPAAAASALTHLFIAWQLLDVGIKALVLRCLYDIFEVRGFALVVLGKQRPFTAKDIRDPELEDELLLQSRLICDDSKQRQANRSILLLL